LILLFCRYRRDSDAIAGPGGHLEVFRDCRPVRAVRRILAVPFAALLVAGCSGSAGGGERVVFRVASGFSQGGPATTADVIDVGVGALRNVTGHSVRLRKISLVAEPEAVTAQMTAYRYSQTVTGLGIEHGNLLAHCRRSLTPYPVTDVIAGPHSDSGWLVIIALRFAEPGRYRLDRVRIDYTTNGQPGWQYQNLNTTIVVSAARKGTRPRFDGCP
jgi:hypothetical protein